MVDVCDKLYCDKLRVGGVEMAFNELSLDKIKVRLNLDEDGTGLVSDGNGNITTKPLPLILQDLGVIKGGKCDMFSETISNTIPFNTIFNKAPKIIINLKFSDGNTRYLSSGINNININNFTIDSQFKANKANKLLPTNITESKCLNLYYSGYGIVISNGKSLSFINNQSFDGSGPYQYQTIITDEIYDGFDSILSVDGYPMVTYTRLSNNYLILGICNSLSGLGKWSFTTNNSIGLYPNLIVTETRKVSIINYDGYSLISSIIDEGVWLSTKIDTIKTLTGISACNIDKYNIMVATKANAASDCRVYFSDPSCTTFELSLTSEDVWLNIDVGVLYDGRPMVVTSSLNGIKMYYTTDNKTWNTVKISDEIPNELSYLLLGNGQSMIAYYIDNTLILIYGDIVKGEWKTIKLGDIKNISCINTHNGYVRIAGSAGDQLTDVLSANKYCFVEDINDFQIYWYAVGV